MVSDLLISHLNAIRVNKIKNVATNLKFVETHSIENAANDKAVIKNIKKNALNK